MKKEIKQAFPKYRRIQAGATIKLILVKRKRKVHAPFGLNAYSYTEKYEEKLLMVVFKKVCRSNCGLYDSDVHQVYVAVDQQNKTVYWNYERIS
jgi:hypothetical protein